MASDAVPASSSSINRALGSVSGAESAPRTGLSSATRSTVGTGTSSTLFGHHEITATRAIVARRTAHIVREFVTEVRPQRHAGTLSMVRPWPLANGHRVALFFLSLDRHAVRIAHVNYAVYVPLSVDITCASGFDELVDWVFTPSAIPCPSCIQAKCLVVSFPVAGVVGRIRFLFRIRFHFPVVSVVLAVPITVPTAGTTVGWIHIARAWADVDATFTQTDVFAPIAHSAWATPFVGRLTVAGAAKR